METISPRTGSVDRPARTAGAVAATLLTAGLLIPVQVVLERPMLLAERFVPGAGWAELVLLALYAGAVTWWMADPRKVAKVRRRVWLLFSVVFFAQLALGLAGIEQCLMTGELHLPVPAMILAGPLYRGHAGFMVILLAGTLLLVGPAWCSHLCYFGAWDDVFSRLRKRPQALPGWRRWVQGGLLLGVAGVAWTLNRAGASATVATTLGLGFGVVGVAVMAWWSRRTGQMVHCIVWCPIGLVTTTLGKLSPFRIRIDDSCDRCGSCHTACRYDALNETDLDRRTVAWSCTLCGECLRTCPQRSIRFAFLGLGPNAARTTFLVLVVTLHAMTLGMARI